MRIPRLLVGFAALIGCTTEKTDAKLQTSFNQVGPIENASFGRAKRVAARIAIPLGRSREAVTGTLERAAREILEREGANAAMIFAYRPEDEPSGNYTVGRAIYAPNGNWEEAGVNGPLRFKVDLGSLYFKSGDSSGGSAKRVAVGDTVQLGVAPDDTVLVSRNAEKWGDEQLVGRVPSGRHAVILARTLFPLTADVELVRLEIRTIGPGPAIKGWVTESDARKP